MGKIKIEIIVFGVALLLTALPAFNFNISGMAIGTHIAYGLEEDCNILAADFDPVSWAEGSNSNNNNNNGQFLSRVYTSSSCGGKSVRVQILDDSGGVLSQNTISVSGKNNINNGVAFFENCQNEGGKIYQVIDDSTQTDVNIINMAWGFSRVSEIHIAQGWTVMDLDNNIQYTEDVICPANLGSNFRIVPPMDGGSACNYDETGTCTDSYCPLPEEQINTENFLADFESDCGINCYTYDGVIAGICSEENPYDDGFEEYYVPSTCQQGEICWCSESGEANSAGLQLIRPENENSNNNNANNNNEAPCDWWCGFSGWFYDIF